MSLARDEKSILHCAGIAKYNAFLCRKMFKKTGDRYYLGEWKVWYRVYKRLTTTENGKRYNSDWGIG